MSGELDWIAVALTIITAATPLIYAAIGELVTERSGVLNLGVEGMMLVGAVLSFLIVHVSGSATLAIAAGIFGGMAMAALFAFLVLGLQSSQVATGLALSIFGMGLSALLGQSLVGVGYAGLPELVVPGLAEIPILGRLLFRHDILVYGAALLVPAVWWFLFRSRAGLVLRSVGESHEAAHALGTPVLRVRLWATLFGGACSGLAGAYLSLAYAPMWVENMSAGRGWIALALVVFASWMPWRVLAGAYLFGGITILQLNGQAMGIALPSQLMSMLPYIATILVLVFTSRNQGGRRQHAPSALGRVFRPD